MVQSNSAAGAGQACCACPLNKHTSRQIHNFFHVTLTVQCTHAQHTCRCWCLSSVLRLSTRQAHKQTKNTRQADEAQDTFTMCTHIHTSTAHLSLLVLVKCVAPVHSTSAQGAPPLPLRHVFQWGRGAEAVELVIAAVTQDEVRGVITADESRMLACVQTSVCLRVYFCVCTSCLSLHARAYVCVLACVFVYVCVCRSCVSLYARAYP
jgi:hypothetical protein